MSVSGYSAQTFPLQGFPLITPYWGDVDTRGTGNVFYRITTANALLEKAKGDVHSVYSDLSFFVPTQLLIATWDHVGYYNQGVNLVSCNSNE